MRVLIVATLIFLVAFLFSGVASEICQRLNPSFFQRCIDAGYNYTAHFPKNNRLHEEIIAKDMERIGRQFEQCSKYSDLIVCSIFVPKCVEGNNSPVLPCRSVCEEFARECEAKLEHGDRLEWIKGLCQLLPSNDDGANSDGCLVPENFKPRYNTTTPLTQKCEKLSMPSCANMGYNYTTLPRDSQVIFDNVLKGRLLRKFGNHTLCSPILKKIFCFEFAPPCFPEDGPEIVLRTVCKEDCELVEKECPDLYQKHFGEYSYCEQMATGVNDSLGYCKLTKWPAADRWLNRPKEKVVPSVSSVVPSSPSVAPSPGLSSSSPSPSPTPLPLGEDASLPMTAIVVSAVLVSLSIAAVVVVVVFVVRKKGRLAERFRVRGYRHHMNEWETTVSLKT